MALPGVHTLNTVDLTAYTPSCAASPVAAYFRCNMRGTIKKMTGILGGAITVADATITVTNVTQSTTVGTFALTQSGSAAGLLFSGAPASSAVAQVNEDDILAYTPSGATGTNIPAHFSLVIRTA